MAREKKKEELSLEEKLEQALVPVEEWPYEVPGNWCWTKVGGVCIIENGYAFKADKFSENGMMPVIRISNIMGNEVNIDGCVYTTEKDIDNKFLAKYGDLLIAMSGATTGKTGLFLSNIPAYVNQRVGIIRVRNKNVLLPEFRNYYIMEKEQEILQSAYGGAQPNISSNKICDMNMPLPPLQEQKRVVGQIERLFVKLDEVKKKTQAVVNDYELRKSAILHKAFTGELTEKWRKEHGVELDSWERKRYSEFCNIVRGGSPRPAGSPEFYNGNIPFMKVADITKNSGPYVNSTEYTIKEAGLKKTRMVQANTLLLTNSGATLGVPAICTFNTTFNDGIVAFLGLNTDCLLFHYYFWVNMTAKLREINKGAAQPNLNTDIIGAVEINMPEEAEQKEIINILNRLLEKERLIKEDTEVVLDQIDTMKKTILARAFRGELGTNDPAEESAVELLRKIL